MKIRFGINLDGQRGWRHSNRLGHTVVGPMGLLGILETQLGLHVPNVSQVQRVVQYRDCLSRSNTDARFYHETFALDELGTAATLLGWRDQWLLHGWTAAMDTGTSLRLRDMADVERLACVDVAHGIAERLNAVHVAMQRRRLCIEAVLVPDPLSAFPLCWQRVLNDLPVTYEGLVPGVADGMLGDVQRALLAVANGGAVESVSWRDDGSLRVIRSESRLLAGRWLASDLTNVADQGLLVSEAESVLLDEILFASDGARQGFSEASAFRPALQVLPLALDMIWEPVNLYRLLEFLTHPICPLPRYARSKLAEKLAASPGIGGALWQEVLSKIDEHDADSATEVREKIQCWIECERYSQDEGAPIAAVLERVGAVAQYFHVRLADNNLAARLAFMSGFSQCKACIDSLNALCEQGVAVITPRQLQRLVSQATSRGTDNALLQPEVGALLSVTDAAAVCDDVAHIFWWQCGLPAMPSAYPWSSTELADLRRAGCDLPAIADVLQRTVTGWLRPVLFASKSLTLVLPPAGEEAHPLWLMLQAILPNMPVADVSALLQTGAHNTVEIAHQPLPIPRRWWQLPADAPAFRPLPRDSFSSLEMFIFNPAQWLLKYPAKLRASDLLSISDTFRLFGNLSHALVERFYRQENALVLSPINVSAWFDSVFITLINEEGATLLMPGRKADLEHFRSRMRESLLHLHRQFVEAGVNVIVPEMELTGRHAGGDVYGYADLVVWNAQQQCAVVDMKWAGAKKYPEKLKNNTHLQLAIYADMLRQAGNNMPAVSYYLLSDSRLLAQDNHFFPNARVVAPESAEHAGHVWLRFGKTWQWRQAQVLTGRYEWVLDGIEADVDSASPDDGLPMEVLNENYNDFVALGGWDA